MNVGDKIFLVPREGGNAHRRNKKPVEVIITKIANKYYYAKQADYGTEYKIYKTTNVVDNGIYSSEYDAFFDLTEVEEKAKVKEMLGNIRDKIGHYGATSISNDQIKQIHDILN